VGTTGFRLTARKCPDQTEPARICLFFTLARNLRREVQGITLFLSMLTSFIYLTIDRIWNGVSSPLPTNSVHQEEKYSMGGIK